MPRELRFWAAGKGALLATLLLYRCLHYIPPFGFALLLLTAHALWLHRRMPPPPERAGAPFGQSGTS